MRNLTSPKTQDLRCWVGFTPDEPFSESMQEAIRDEIGEVVSGRRVGELEMTDRYVLAVVELRRRDDVGNIAQVVARAIKRALPISTPFRDLELHRQSYAGTVGPDLEGDLDVIRKRLREEVRP